MPEDAEQIELSQLRLEQTRRTRKEWADLFLGEYRRRISRESNCNTSWVQVHSGNVANPCPPWPGTWLHVKNDECRPRATTGWFLRPRLQTEIIRIQGNSKFYKNVSKLRRNTSSLVVTFPCGASIFSQAGIHCSQYITVNRNGWETLVDCFPIEHKKIGHTGCHSWINLRISEEALLLNLHLQLYLYMNISCPQGQRRS